MDKQTKILIIQIYAPALQDSKAFNFHQTIETSSKNTKERKIKDSLKLVRGNEIRFPDIKHWKQDKK